MHTVKNNYFVSKELNHLKSHIEKVKIKAKNTLEKRLNFDFIRAKLAKNKDNTIGIRCE